MQTMTKREAQRIVKLHGRQVRYYWQGSNLIRACYDSDTQIWRDSLESAENHCYDMSKSQAERSAWISEAADCEAAETAN